MNIDGTGITQLTSNAAVDHYPCWSPDGEFIAFVSERDGNPEIYSMRADGTDETRLTNDPANDWWPSWGD
jgi:Tol biopolymer transport system component